MAHIKLPDITDSSLDQFTSGPRSSAGLRWEKVSVAEEYFKLWLTLARFDCREMLEATKNRSLV